MSDDFASPTSALVTVSRTRWRILELAAERPRTVSELARELGIRKSAVHEHAVSLRDAGLLSPRETTRKWIYYETAAIGLECMDRVRTALGDARPRREAAP